jgi:hypothetical protein
MAAYLCYEARKKWPKDFVAGRKVITSVWGDEPKAMLESALTTSMTATDLAGGARQYSFDLLAVEKRLQQFLPETIRRAT